MSALYRARVALAGLDADGSADVGELLGAYADELRATAQDGEPEQMDPSVSTE